MNKMSRLEKKLATIILMVVCVGLVALVLHFFVYKPNTEQIEQLEITKNTLNRTYQNKNDKPEDLDAVIYYPNIHRYYPNDELASNIVGFFPYRNPNSQAAYGIEQYYDDILSAKTISHRFSSFISYIVKN